MHKFDGNERTVEGIPIFTLNYLPVVWKFYKNIEKCSKNWSVLNMRCTLLRENLLGKNSQTIYGK